MTVFNVKGIAVVIFLTALMGAILSSPVLAQNQNPLQLKPLVQTRLKAKNIIRSEALNNINSESAGILHIANGGFGADMWQGTSRAIAERLLEHLPVNTDSSAMRDLMKRLLLSSALVPQGVGQIEDFDIFRINLLLAMGEYTAVNEILRILPHRDNDKIVRLKVDLHLLNGDEPKACALAINQAEQVQESYWQQMIAFCQALAGESRKALLSLDLMREVNAVDSIFAILLEAVIAKQEGHEKISQISTIKANTKLSPLYLAMIRAGGISIASVVKGRNSPNVLKILAHDKEATIQQRTHAAERAEMAGVLTTAELRKIYPTFQLKPREVKNPLTSAELTKGPRRRAILLAAVNHEKLASEKAKIMAKAFDLAQQDKTYLLIARLFADHIDALNPINDLSWFAPYAIRAMLSLSNIDKAQRWFILLRAVAQSSERALKTLIAVQPFIHLSYSLDEEWRGEFLTQWRDSFLSQINGETKISETMKARALLFYSLLDGLGKNIDDKLWLDLIGDNKSWYQQISTNTSVFTLLRNAAANKRKAETVAAGLIALGEAGPKRTAPQILNHVLRAFMQVGLTKEAATIAIEAAVVNGL